MIKVIQLSLLLSAVLLGASPASRAADSKEIESITVLADSHLALPLSEIASAFTHQQMTSVSNVFGNSLEQKKKIEDGEPGDVFITGDGELVQQLKVKGLVDVYSIGEIAHQHGVHYIAAVVAGENMTPARGFLDYLKSPEARALFKHNGLNTP